MSRIKQLQQQRTDAMQALRVLHEQAQSRELTEDETKAWDTHKASVAKIDTEITREEEMLALERSQSTLRPGSFTPVRPGSNVVVTLDEADRPFASLGDQLQAIRLAGMPGGTVDPRLSAINAAASGAGATVSADAGFLVQHDFSTDLFMRAYETGVLASRCYPVEVSANANGVEIPFIDEDSRANGSRWGGVRVYRRAEAETVTATRPKIGKWQLELEDMMAIAYATERSLEDASVLGQIFTDSFTDEFAFKLDDEIFRGKGAGECLGILEAPCTVTVSKESGQAADTVVPQNIMKMYARLWGRSFPNSVWLINQELFEQLPFMTLGSGTVSTLFMPAGGLSELPYSRLLSRPVIPIEQCSALGDLGDIALVDLMQYVLIRKGKIRADQSIHVRFVYDERAFRWVTRVNGQPKWKKALTPYKATAGKTLSPFVILEAR